MSSFGPRITHSFSREVSATETTNEALYNIMVAHNSILEDISSMEIGNYHLMDEAHRSKFAALLLELLAELEKRPVEVAA